jgi:uncharacterized membrane protein
MPEDTAQEASLPMRTIASERVLTIDIVRGLVMIIMVLDHVRDLLHVSSLTQSPTDLATTTPALFFSRWVTYLCAPTFVFLSGVSAWLSVRQSPDIGRSQGFLVKRGVWLILLEFTLVNFALWFDVQFRLLILQVIAAIGAGFIVLSALLRVSPRMVGIVSALIVATHNLLQFAPQSDIAFLNTVRNFLFTPGVLQASSGFTFFIPYPLVPWIAILLLGYSFGKIVEKSKADQNRVLLTMGLGFLISFTVLRLVNSYGDPVPWKVEKNTMLTCLSFLNVTKYPPSLIFTLLFLGIMFLLLRFADRLSKSIQHTLAVYGRVPLFYYLLHLYLIRLSVFIMVFAQGYRWHDLLFGPFQFGRPATGSGLNLLGVFLVWVGIVALLYPLCQWYGNYKKDNAGVWWLRYL